MQHYMSCNIFSQYFPYMSFFFVGQWEILSWLQKSLMQRVILSTILRFVSNQIRKLLWFAMLSHHRRWLNNKFLCNFMVLYLSSISSDTCLSFRLPGWRQSSLLTTSSRNIGIWAVQSVAELLQQTTELSLLVTRVKRRALLCLGPILLRH